jgi:Domain of unknown function (DUF4389)
MSGGKVVLAVVGALLGLLAVGLLAAGGGLLWAYGTQRSDDGYFTSPTTELSTGTYALTSADIDLGASPQDWFPSGQLATVRFEVDSADGPMFVGIGPEDDVDAYLDGVGVAEVTHVGIRASDVTYRTTQGSAPAAAPTEETFWVASADGTGSQTLTWDLEGGRWAVVIMNADGSQGVNVDVSAAAKVAILLPIAIGVLIAGAVFGVVAAVMLVFAFMGGRLGAETTPVASTGPGAYGHYPVRLEATLDPDLSRWQWIFKWLLAIPHYFVLFFLWIGFMVTTIAAGFAILFTGRYPRSIFEFNVGVLRWSWRVSYYSYGALGTDKYPPFTLGPADYPAEFDVAYPEELSRGLVLVKWWLLAIPHYLIVGVFTSGLVWWMTNVGESGNAAVRTGGGLIGLLVFVAALALLFTGRYPNGLFDLVIGLNRWVFRVAAYATLMRDEYPPFRLDIGGAEPGTNQAAPVEVSPGPGE